MTMPEQDKQLKEILLNSAEKAPAGFTQAVMKKVTGLSATSFQYQPLVSERLKRRFMFAFGTLTAAILALCLIITLTNIHLVSRIQNIELPAVNYSRVLIFIVTFWIVFTVKELFEKKLLSRSTSV